MRNDEKIKVFAISTENIRWNLRTHGVLMKFFLSNGEYLREKLQVFPFAREFVSSRLLVVCTDDVGKIVGACGVRGLLNTAFFIYVRKNYRGRGVGSRLLKKAIEVAEKRPPNFVTATISSENVVISHMVCKLGFKEVLFLKKSRQVLLVTSTTRIGRLACGFFRMVGLLLPDNFLLYVHLWLYARTL